MGEMIINGLFNEQLAGKKNVVGAGYGHKNGRGEVGITVLVNKKMPLSALDSGDIIPKSINGIVTDVLEVGEISVSLPQKSSRERFRPAPGGVSIGHYKITAGTFGGIVRDVVTGDRLILSNNHVLANSNDAVKGDEILQPGPYDGGTLEEDLIGLLERFVPIEFTGTGTCPIATGTAKVVNLVAKYFGWAHRLHAVRTQQEPNIVDAAVARPARDLDVLDEILDIGIIRGTTDSVLGMKVRKHGRTTELTQGTIVVVGTTINVNYGDHGTAQFVNQVVTTPMSEGGDSGSLVVSDQLAVGLLFAGSPQATIYNPISAVLEKLNVYFDESVYLDLNPVMDTRLP